MSPFAQLESDLTSACYAALANVTVTPQAGGDSFGATLDHATADEWSGAARTSSHVLRYASGQGGPVLAADALLDIAAGNLLEVITYKVVGQPRQINGSEYQADLVAVSA